MKDKNYKDYSDTQKFIINSIAIANTGYSLKERKHVAITTEEAIEIYEKEKEKEVNNEK